MRNKKCKLLKNQAASNDESAPLRIVNRKSRHKNRHSWLGVTPVIETNCHWHTCRLMVFSVQTASSPSELPTVGEAEAGTAPKEPSPAAHGFCGTKVNPRASA